MAAGVSIETFLKTSSAAFTPSVKSLRAILKRTEGKHDLVSVSTAQGDAATLSSSPSVPTAVVIEANGLQVIVNGYLDTGSAARHAGPADNVLTVMGVTSVMRDATARAWVKARPSDIAAEVLGPYRLGMEFDKYDSVIEFFSQSEGESDWQTLVRLAQKIGFSLVSEGPVVRFVDVDEEARRTMSYGYETLVLPTGGGTPTNVTLFQLMTTTTPAGADYRDWLMAGTDPLGQRFEYKVSYSRGMADIEPEFSALHTGTFTSLSQAMVEADKVRRQARWAQTAKVRCIGYRPLRPGRNVLVVDPRGAFGGFWYVTDVEHSFDNVANVSATGATLCRLAPVSSKRRIVVPPSKPPNIRLYGGRWQCDRFWQKVA